jgi:hypothetical protein
MLWGNFTQKYDFRHFFALFPYFLDFFSEKRSPVGGFYLIFWWIFKNKYMFGGIYY